MAANLCTIELTLHKVVLYAFNRGRYRPNEINHRNPASAGFLLLWVHLELLSAPESKVTFADKIFGKIAKNAP